MGEETLYEIDELCRILSIQKGFLERIEREGLICLQCNERGIKTCTEQEAQRIRMIWTLVHDLGVNLPGAEIILHMRERMIEMQRQFDRILEYFAEEVRKEVRRLP